LKEEEKAQQEAEAAAEAQRKAEAAAAAEAKRLAKLEAEVCCMHFAHVSSFKQDLHTH
jgi:hypothetical protein